MANDKPQQPRIIAGSAKGMKLRVVGDARPITDRMKQSLFDTIREYIPDAAVLDLYAGSGSLGIEALSRGAASCEFVDNDPEVITALNQNLQQTHLADRAIVTEINAGRFIQDASTEYDLVFCDPPYHALENFALHKLGKLLHDQSLLILKLPSDFDLPELKTIPLIHEQQFGNNKIVILGKNPPA